MILVIGVDLKTILCNRVIGAIVQDSGGITEEDKANLYAAVGPFPRIGYAATSLNFRRNNEFWLPLSEHSVDVDAEKIRQYSKIVHWSGRVTDDGARALAGHAKLVSADISTSDNLTDNGVKAIFEGCPNLAKINVSGCWFVDDLRVFRGKSLTSLTLSKTDIRFDHFSALGRACPLLERIDVALMGPTVLQAGALDLVPFTHLREIDMSGNIVGPANKLDIENKTLERLKMAFCRNLKHVSIRCPNVRRINLEACPALEEVSIPEDPAHLIALNLYGCSTLRSVSPYPYKKLLELNIAHCVALFDDTPFVEQLMTCTRLISSRVYGCINLSAAVIQALTVP